MSKIDDGSGSNQVTRTPEPVTDAAACTQLGGVDKPGKGPNKNAKM